MRFSACSVALVLLFSGSAFAQAPADAPPPGAPPVIAPPPVVEAAPVAAVPAAAAPAAAPAAAWYNSVKLEALVDSYYQYNFSGSDSTVGPAARAFDVTSNSFSLNYAKVGMQVDASPVMVRIDLGYGHTGAIINGSGLGVSGIPVTPGAPTGAALALYSNAFIVQQAFAELSLGAFTLDAGKFVTTASAEVIESNKNWLYSRSMLFGLVPFLHTGIRAGYKVNDKVALQASLVNGINNDPDNNSAKTGGFSATITPISSTSIIATGYFGKEGPQGATGDTIITTDFVVAHTVSDKLGLNLNVDYVKAGETNAVGVSLMGRLVVNDNLFVAARGEFLKNKNFIAALGDTSLYEGTGMVGLPFGHNMEIRAELRLDGSADPVLNGKKNQFTGTLAFLGFL